MLCFLIAEAQQSFFIPAQKIQPYRILGHNDYGYIGGNKFSGDFTMAIDSFEMSGLITLGQYKEYLTAIKKDSSELYYQAQLPDPKMLSKEDYSKYLSDRSFEKFPVAGVSWDAAMNYCKWRTLRQNIGPLEFIYRLPKISEWLSAYAFLKGNDKNDLSKNYSDWTMSLYFEGGSFSDTTFAYDILYIQNINDKPRDKRKRVIGGSYLIQHESLGQHLSRGYYSFEGHREIGFRLIKEYLKNDDPKSLPSRIMQYWGIPIGN